MSLGRYIAFDGAIGECPDYYPIIQAAKYLGVPPWELIKQPAYWRISALKCMQAEANAQKILESRQK